MKEDKNLNHWISIQELEERHELSAAVTAEAAKDDYDDEQCKCGADCY